MQLDTVITGLKLLTALLLVCVAYLVLLPYFLRPEEFFIKRLRPERNHKFTIRSFLSGHSWERDSSQWVSIRSPSAWF